MLRLCASRLHPVSIALLALGVVLLAGCGGNGVPEKYKDVEITPVSQSPSIDEADVRITYPKDGAVVEKADVDLKFDVDSFETGIQTKTPRADSLASSEKGQHLHVIVDNKPYMACYDPSEPFDIGELEPGVHTVIAFPSRSYHESVKGPGAYAFPGTYKTYDFVNFYVKEKTGEPMLNTDDPAVLYSRPKGTYSGDDADRILVDFYLHNVELSNKGYKVRFAVTSQKSGTQFARTFTEWTPAYITGTSPGTYEVTLQLLDKNGDVVPGPTNNDTTRTFVVEEPN